MRSFVIYDALFQISIIQSFRDIDSTKWRDIFVLFQRYVGTD